MDSRRYYDMTFLGEVAVSPEGDRVAFVADESDPDNEDRRSTLFVAPADGSESPHRLTHVSAASTPVWSPNGEKLAYVTTRKEDIELSRPHGEEVMNPRDEPESQVWVFDVDRGGEARQVTDFDAGTHDFDWGPDGNRLVVAARDPTDEQVEMLERRERGIVEIERLQHKLDSRGWLDPVVLRLFVVDVETRETTRLDDAHGNPEGTDGNRLAPAWAPGGRIAFRSTRTEAPDDTNVVDVYTVDPEGGRATKVTGSDVVAGPPRWSPDGERLAFAANDPENAYVPSQLYLADDEDVGPVAPDFDRPLSTHAGPRWLDNDTVLAAVGDEGRTVLYRFDVTGGGAGRVFTDQGALRSLRYLDVAGDTVACSLSVPDDDHDVYTFPTTDLERGTALTRLSYLNRELIREYASPDCEHVHWENAAGDRVEGILYTPSPEDSSSVGPLPLVVSLHGGPVAYDDPEFRFEYVHWTNDGYAVLRPNYSGSSSYGREFCESIRGDWGSREVDDVLAGVDELVARGIADERRLFVTGFSYGAILTGYLVTRTDRFAAAAAEHGIYDCRASFGADDAHRRWTTEFGLPWLSHEVYERASSIVDVDAVSTPVLVTAGGRDWRCPPSQAEQLYVSVRKQGVDAKLVVYENEHHTVGAPERAVHRLELLDEWFASHDPDCGSTDT